MPTEPRFLIDTHTKRSIDLTTDEVQALLWREELIGEAYFERKKSGDENGFWGSVKIVEGGGEGCS